MLSAWHKVCPLETKAILLILMYSKYHFYLIIASANVKRVVEPVSIKQKRELASSLGDAQKTIT